MTVLKKTVKKVKTIEKKAKIKQKKAKQTSKLPEKLIKYLDQAGINHNVLEHRTVYTAMDAAATMKKKLGEIAKSLLVKADKDYYLVLLPADYNLDFLKLGKVIGKHNKKEVKVIKIPGEEIMADLLKIKKGSLSAFGKLHNLPVVVEDNLNKVKKAIFSSGSYNHSIEMAVKDFVKAESAILGKFGLKKKIKPAPKPAKKKVKKSTVKIKPKKKIIKKK